MMITNTLDLPLSMGTYFSDLSIAPHPSTPKPIPSIYPHRNLSSFDGFISSLMGLVSVFIRTHFLAFNGFPSDPPPDTTMIPRRRRVLFTFGSLILSVIVKVFKRMHISATPRGENAKMLCAIENQWLTVLSFFDDHIIVFEDLIETLFPPSARLFDKIDDILRASDSLPPKLDDFMDHDIPNAMRCVPFLERFFKKDEKEIVIDITCHGYRIEPENSSKYENAMKADNDNEMFSKERDVSDASKDEFRSLKVQVEGMEENNEEHDKEEHATLEDSNREILYSAKATMSHDEIFRSEDPIFELFDAGWHMSPRALSSASSV